MKLILIFTALLCTYFLSTAQSYSSNCTSTPLLEKTYHNDACRLSIIRLHQINSPIKDSISIPQIFVDSALKALYAIENMQNAIVVDTIRRFFGHLNFTINSDSTHFNVTIDTFPCFGIKKIKLVVDNANWGAQWLLGNYSNTSNDSVNYFIRKYGLQVEKENYQIYATRTTYVITSPLAINAGALARTFEHFYEVGLGWAHEEDATLNLNGNGQGIKINYLNDTLNITYKYGCGDCPSGCTLGRIWKFNILSNQNCKVAYLSVENTGSPIQWETGGGCLEYTTNYKVCAPIDSAKLYTYILGNINFQWRESIDGTNYFNISDDSNIIGTNTPTLHLYNVPSNWYGRKFNCVINSVPRYQYFSFIFENTWNTLSDTAWENPSNWSCGKLPDSYTDVIIKQGNIIVHSDVTIRSLTVAPGATLTVAPGKNLTILH
jgi:hypothetical protein